MMYAPVYAVYVLTTILTCVLFITDPTPPGRHPVTATLLFPAIAFVFFVLPMSLVNLFVLVIDAYRVFIKKKGSVPASTFQRVRLFVTPLMYLLIFLAMRKNAG